MAKKPTVTTLQSGFNSTEVLNENFENIRDAFDNTLSLDGSTPNAMQADLDLNGNNLIGATGLLINGTDYLADVEAAKSAALVAQAAAELAENNAETAEVNAEASETDAGLSATAAATSATAAQTARTAAELAEINAETAETGAAASAVTAASKAATATTKASEASASAAAAALSEAGVDADRVAAQAAASAAASSETNAATSATNAATSATNAANSATSASNSASSASSSAANAGSSETAASTSATAAAASALAAAGESAEATTQASNAAASATAAATSETNAATSEANALSYVADSESARDQSQAARDAANLHKLAAEAAATSATNTAAALTGFDLEAIAASKAVTAVDVFVYDTSKDSDGGAWRKRTQGTSWYNEALNTATRGSRREFPAVAVIVAETNKVTIYDGDDPSLPMWMVFNGTGSLASTNGALGSAASTFSTISAKNGTLVAGHEDGLQTVDFNSEDCLFFNNLVSRPFLGAISKRNDSVGLGDDLGSPIVNRIVNDVAMTVLPNAPIDPATGLPVPTIAVATAGGVSVIKDDGTVVDINKTSGNNTWNRVAFTEQDQLKMHSNIISVTWLLEIPSADIGSTTAGGPAEVSSFTATNLTVSGSKSPRYLGYSGNGSSLPNNWGSSSGLTFHSRSAADEDRGMVAYTTSTYNTGWMNGDIKGAFLSSTDTASLVGSGELVTNGTFDTDVSGWSDSSTGTGSISWNASGYLDLNSTDSDNRGIASQSFSTVVGETYVITSSQVGGLSGLFRVGTSVGGSQNLSQSQVTGDYVNTFVATATTTYVTIYGNPSGTTSYDNISVKLADADRSVNNKGLAINGTVTRSPVATGADLVAYDCSFGYLYRDFAAEFSGSDTFCLMGWHYGDPDKSGNFFNWYETVGGGTSAAYLNTYIDFSTGAYRLVWQGRASLLPNTTPSISGRWALVALVFSANTVKYYLDGVLVYTASGVPTADLHELRINPNGGNKNALLRISATAPTAEQIAKIYNDEKVLFQENAQATLYGSSDAVTALAHDDATDLLHVGTSAGRSVFQGLRRVSNTTTAVGTAISASNGLVVEE